MTASKTAQRRAGRGHGDRLPGRVARAAGDEDAPARRSRPGRATMDVSPLSVRAAAMAAVAVASFSVARLGADAFDTGDPETGQQAAGAGDRGLESGVEDLRAADLLGPGQVVGALDVDVVAVEVEGLEVGGGQPQGLVVLAHVGERDAPCGPSRRPRQVAVQLLEDAHRAGRRVGLEQGAAAEGRAARAHRSTGVVVAEVVTAGRVRGSGRRLRADG